MSGPSRARSAFGSRSPGPVDTKSAFASGFHYDNAFSMLFGGTNEYVSGPTLSSLASFADQISISFWFKWDSGDTPDAWQGICNSTNSWNSLSEGFGFYWETSTLLKFYVNGFNVDPIGTTISNVNIWHHVVGVYDGTLGTEQLKLYVDGAEVGTATKTGNIVATNNVEIGRTANSDTPTQDYTIGNLDEFSIWSNPLSSDEVVSIYNSGAPIGIAFDSGNYTSSSNLKLWWRCGDQGDTVSAGGIQDQSGNGHDGTANNMESGDFVTDVPTGA